jgi:endo-1,4-beta-xylanase
VRRPNMYETIGAGVVAAGLVLAPVVGALPSTIASAAGPVTVLSTTFEGGSYAPWSQSGEVGLSVVDVEGNPALLVSGRGTDFAGIESPKGLLERGVSYTYSMRARLAEGTVGTAGVQFVTKPGYTWVGGGARMTADAWTTVTGTFAAPTDGDPAPLQVFVGTGDLPVVAPYDYLVDDLVITGPAAGGDPGTPGTWTPDLDEGFVPGGAVAATATPVSAARGTGNVAALTFDDGPNAGDTEELLTYLAAKDIKATFCVIGQNITAPGGADVLRRIVAEGHTLCNHSTNYDDMGALTEAQVEQDLKANLAIIRGALGNPNAEVPYFRAPNGTWGKTQAVAVALGMQPLAVTNTISDWEQGRTEAELTSNLRAAMKPGEIVLVHDGGGPRTKSVAAVRTVVEERLADGWTFTLPQGGAAPGGTDPGTGGPTTPTGLSTGFEDSLGPWSVRGDGTASATVTDTEAATGTRSAQVTGRTLAWNGLGASAASLQSGKTYAISAKVKLPVGTSGSADIRLSVERDADGASDQYVTATTVPGVTASEWKTLEINYTIPAAPRLVYFESATGTLPFLVDDVSIELFDATIQDLTPIKSTVAFPVGAAIDSRETAGAPSQLLLKHFDQITPENHMKPEAWYDENAGEESFRINPEAKALMDFAAAKGVNVYGHVLVWHSQTPAWFFQDAAGNPLGTGAADKAILRDRMRTHIFKVAEALSTGGGYGEFGSSTNPLVAFDVVNEVVSDGTENADGMRNSEWYRILGEEFVDLAFEYANEAFNGEFAAAGKEHPVTLFINDYNTEQSGKQQRYLDLVERLLERDVPLDGVGHQFHVNLAMPVSALRGALDRFADLQVVTELDVTTGTPVTDARLIDQGYYYRDAFRAFRQFAAEDRLFSATIWGLTDGRSWRNSSGAPLLFGDDLQAKPAYYGVVDGDLPAAQRAAVVFQGDVPLDDDAPSALAWWQLPLHEVSDTVGFQLRWAGDHLTAFVAVDDETVDATDGIVLQYGDRTVAFGRDGTGDVEGVVEEVDGGYAAVVHLPLPTPGVEGATLPFDVRVTQGTQETGWNTAGTLGTLTLVEPLSYTEVVQASAPPSIDGDIEGAWADASSVTTSKQISGTGGATADVRTLWDGQTLYVLAEVTDDVLDTSGTDPWVKDSLEIFLNPGNIRSDSYLYDDTQIRINARNEVSFGTGDEAFQRARVQSATRVTDGGYVVEAAIDLLSEYAGLHSFQGLDFQVNDAEGGVRTSTTSWADPTGLGYQTPERWGVAQLVEAASPAEPGDPTSPGDGGPVAPGNGGPGTPPQPPTGAGAGAAAAGNNAAAGRLATTGAQVAGLLAAAAALIGGGTYLVQRRRRALS